jgi:hypothetical protein
MVQQDLHRLKMTFLSSHEESRVPILSETQPYILSACSYRGDNNHRETRRNSKMEFMLAVIVWTS